MIQSAMMFALGIFVSGLVWLAFSVALVRRARRLTERRLLAGIATRRAEFDVEREQLRARHAVQMHRLEREVSRVLDMATAYRLDADLKERDLMIARAELDAHRDDVSDVETRLKGERDTIQDLERRHAEAGSGLRAAQHQLALETKRRAAAEEALDEASILADQRRVALAAMREENNTLRARLGEEPGAPLPFEHDMPKLPRAVPAVDDEEHAVQAAVAEAAEPAAEAMPAQEVAAAGAMAPRKTEEPEPAGGASVVPLPTRPRPAPVGSPEQTAAAVAEAARDLKRLAEDAAESEAAEQAAEQAAAAAPRMPEVTVPAASIGDLVALRVAASIAEDKAKSKRTEPEVGEKAESQFFEALAEIRALKRAGNQAGE